MIAKTGSPIIPTETVVAPIDFNSRLKIYCPKIVGITASKKKYVQSEESYPIKGILFNRL
ncbi:hypothetical protein D3C71_2012510 [compost metagenome]